MAYINNSVYWLGSDGNIYLKSGNTTKNVGQPFNGAASLKPGGFDSNQLSAAATQIADPNPQPVSSAAAPAPSYPNGGGSAAAAGPAPVDKSNDIAVQNAGLAALDTQLSSGLGAIDTALGKLKGQYAEEASANEGNYNTQSDTNQNNLQKNKQTALVNASQGRQGLFGTLASLGALNGSGIDLANRAVQKGANDDLSGAADNYSTNQNQLDTAINTFRREDKNRNQNADTAAENARQNVRNDVAKSRMGFYSNLSSDYADMLDKGNAAKYAQLAGSLYPEMAKTSIPNSNIAYSGAAFTPGTLSDYLAGANSTQVSATPTEPGQTIPGLVASPAQRKKQLATV